MLESYKVGATLELRDEVSTRLRGIFEKVEQFEKLLKGVQKQLTAFGDTKLGGIGGSLTAVSDKLRAIGTGADGAANKFRSSFQSMDGSITASGRALSGYLVNLDRIGLVADAEATAAAKAFGRIDGAVATSDRAVGTLDTRLASIGTTAGTSTSAAIGHLGQLNSALATSTQAAQGLRGAMRMPAGGGGGGGHNRPGQGGGHSASGGHPRNTYGSHGAYVDAGIFGMIGYESVKESVEASLHRGMELAHVQQQMVQAGIAQPDIDRATTGAWKEARTYGLDVSKVLGDIKELVLPFGSVGHAIEFIEPLEKMRVVLNAVSEGRGNESSEAVYKMARAGELKGLNNPEDYLRYFDGMTKAISASGGKVTPNSFAQVTQYGKLASQGWSEEFYTKSLPTLMQTMNASTAGQSLMSLFNTLESGAVSKRSFEQMDVLGLIGDRSKINYEQGKYKGLSPGAIVGSHLLAENPLEWARQFLTPLLEKKYGDLGDEKNKLTAIENLGGLFGNRNSAAAIAELALRVKSFDRDKGLIKQAHGIDGAATLLKNDPTTAMNNFSAAWTNMLTALGLPSVATATGALNTLANGMNRIGELAQAHPDAARNIEGALTGLAAGLGALAIVGLAAFAPGGIAVVAMVGFAGAMSGIAAVNWDKVQAASQAMGLSMDNFHKNIASISSAFDTINAALTKFFTGLVSAIRQIPVLGNLLPAEKHKEMFGPNLPPNSSSPLAPGGVNGDASDYGLGGFSPMAYHPAANDNLNKAVEGVGQLGERTGLVSISFDGLDKGTTNLTGKLGTLDTSLTGPSGFKNALDILTETAIGAARALAQVALAGGFGAGGGGSGFMRASLGGSGASGGFGGGGGPINPGQHGWWTMDRQAHAVDVLMKGGVSELGAKALVSRWMNVEASGGPSTVNSIGATGIGQWLGNRKAGLTSDFDGQLNHALRELHGSESRALGYLNSGTALGAATGASQFERAEGYNSRTGMDNFTARTLRGLGAVPGPTTSRTVSPPAPKAVTAEIHLHNHMDGKKIAHAVVKHVVVANRFPTGMGTPDTRSHYVSPGTPLADVA